MNSLLINIEELIKPISDISACGEDISYDNDFLLLKDKRKLVEERSLGQWEERKVLDQKGYSIIDICKSLLIKKSKNLKICAYLIEDLTKKEGLSGFLIGLKLLQHLCEKYWTKLYPIIEKESSLKDRLEIFFWIDEICAFSMGTAKLLNLTSKSDLSFDEIEKYHKLGIYSKNPLENSEEEINIDLFLEEATPEIIHEKIISVIDQISDDLSIFIHLLNKETASESILFPKVTKKISDIKDFFMDLIENKGDDRNADALDGSEDSSVSENYSEKNKGLSAGNSRDQLYEKIELMANNLKKCDPHSPVPDFILKVVSWKNLSFIEIVSVLGADSPFFSLLRNSKAHEERKQPSRRGFAYDNSDDDN